jgi:glycosyltransferase involved in cell wall biosynthesis
MIVVDDGSDDGTPDIAESFQDARVNVIRRPHQGVSGLGRSYAMALELAKSPYVAVLEGDDVWPSSIDERSSQYARYRYSPRHGIGRNDPIGAILPSLVRVNFIVAATVMIRRHSLNAIGGFTQPSNIPYVDHPTWLRLALVGNFARSKRVLGYWRRHSGQITTRNWFEADLDREAYLQGIAEEAQGHVSPAVMAELNQTIRRDASRQREEARIAQSRVALLGGDWNEARKGFSGLLRTGDSRTKAMAAAGVLCAASRVDVEWVIRAMGRHCLPSRRHLASHPHSGMLGSADSSSVSR